MVADDRDVLHEALPHRPGPFRSRNRIGIDEEQVPRVGQLDLLLREDDVPADSRERTYRIRPQRGDGLDAVPARHVDDERRPLERLGDNHVEKLRHELWVVIECREPTVMSSTGSRRSDRTVGNSMSSRLLGITNFYPPLAGGGYGEICGDVMAGLAARGHRVTMLVARGESGRGVQVRSELDYVLAPWRHPARGLRAVANDERVVRSELAQGVDAALVWHMRGMVKPPLTLLHRAGVPVLYLLHDRWVLYERPGGPFLLPWPRLDRVFARRVRDGLARIAAPRVELRAPPIPEEGVVRFVSRWLHNEYACAGWLARDEGILPAGVDVDAIARRRTEPPHIPPQRLLFAGRIHASKGLDVAVRALARMADTSSLIVAGPVDDAAYLGRVRVLARELSVDNRIEWRGEVPREEVLRLLATEDVLVYPSVGDEAYSLGLLEALAAGILVVTSAVGGPGEYLEHGVNSLVFEPGDDSQLAAHLNRLGDDGGLAELLAEGARRTAERLSLDDVLDRLEKTILDASVQH